MKGIIVSRSGSVVRPGQAIVMLDPAPMTVLEDGRSDFARFFTPLLSLLPQYRWIVHADEYVLRFPDAWYAEYDSDTDAYTSPQLRAIEQYVLARVEDWTYVEGAYLAAAAETLVDEWCNFFAVPALAEDLRTFVAGFWQAAQHARLYGFLYPRLILFFAGIDGVRWELFVRDERLLHEVRAHLAALPGITVRETSLQEHLDEFYGRPPAAST